MNKLSRFLLVFFSFLCFFSDLNAQRKMHKTRHNISLNYGLPLNYKNIITPYKLFNKSQWLSLEYEITKKNNGFGVGLLTNFHIVDNDNGNRADTSVFFDTFCKINPVRFANIPDQLGSNCYYSQKANIVDLHVPFQYTRYFNLAPKLKAFVKALIIVRFDFLHYKYVIEEPTFDANRRNILSYETVTKTGESGGIRTPILNYGIGGGLNYNLTDRISLTSSLQYQIGKRGYFQILRDNTKYLFLTFGAKYCFKVKAP